MIASGQRQPQAADAADAADAAGPADAGERAIDPALHVLFIRRSATCEDVAACTGDTVAAVERRLELARADRMAEFDGMWRLSRLGQLDHHASLNEFYRGTGRRPNLQPLYEAFVAANEPFKLCCTEWQLDPHGQPNDHLDFRRDARIIAKLGRIHRAIGRRLCDAGALDARFLRYRSRLDEAWDRLQAGDQSAMTQPGSGSYHDVWMELHSDLLLSLGRERDAHDGY